MPPKVFLTTLLEQIVLHTGDVSVIESHDSMGTLLTVSVHPNDMGLVIGKQGAMIAAIRNVMRGAGARLQERVHVKLNDPREA